MRSGIHINTSSIILLFVSPILGLFYSIKYLDWQYKKWSLIFFIVIFGSIMVLPGASDSVRHQQNVYDHYVGMSIADFGSGLWHIITLNPKADTNDDVFIHIISFVTGGLLGLPRLFFVVVAFFFGYFYITGLSRVLRWDPGIKLSSHAIFLVLIFIIYLGIDSMQTVRTWTGAWILFNGVYGYYQTKKKKYLWLVFAAPLVHAAYLVMALPVLIVIFLNKMPAYVFVGLFITSFFINVSHGPIIQQLNKVELGESKVQAYYKPDPETWKNRGGRSSGNWYAVYGKNKVLHWGANALALSTILLGLYKRKMNTIEVGLFTTGLLMATFANLGKFIPAFSNRMMINAGLYIVATVVLLSLRRNLFHGKGIKLNLSHAIIWCSLLIFIPKVVYVAANIIYYTSCYIIAIPLLGWVSDENVSIREIIEWFL